MERKRKYNLKNDQYYCISFQHTKIKNTEKIPSAGLYRIIPEPHRVSNNGKYKEKPSEARLPGITNIQILPLRVNLKL